MLKWEQNDPVPEMVSTEMGQSFGRPLTCLQVLSEQYCDPTFIIKKYSIQSSVITKPKEMTM